MIQRQSGRIAVEPALRQVSYARRAQGSTGDCDQPSLFDFKLGAAWDGAEATADRHRTFNPTW